MRCGCRASRTAPMLVLLIWSAFIFLFFSASHSKLIYVRAGRAGSR